MCLPLLPHRRQLHSMFVVSIIDLVVLNQRIIKEDILTLAGILLALTCPLEDIALNSSDRKKLRSCFSV